MLPHPQSLRWKNKTVSLETLDKICIASDCSIGDIVDVIKRD
ncbi:helix-turn-helix domain-containing protein [Selenomonas sp. oral taxon 138]